MGLSLLTSIICCECWRDDWATTKGNKLEDSKHHKLKVLISWFCFHLILIIVMTHFLTCLGEYQSIFHGAACIYLQGWLSMFWLRIGRPNLLHIQDTNGALYRIALAVVKLINLEEFLEVSSGTIQGHADFP